MRVKLATFPVLAVAAEACLGVTTATVDHLATRAKAGESGWGAT